MTNYPSIGKNENGYYYAGGALGPHFFKEFHKLLDYVRISKNIKYIVNSCELSDGEVILLSRAIKTHPLNSKLDNVNHPSHYGGKDNPYEVIKVMESWLTPEEFIGAMKFNIHKYNARAKMKGSELENYEKAGFYQIALVDFCKRKNIGVKI